MTDPPNRASRAEALVAELRYVARLHVYGFTLEKVPTLRSVVAGLKSEPSPVSRDEVRRAIECGMEAVAAHDPALLRIGRWSFGMESEARRAGLLEREKQVGREVGRSASSIRQTDLPAVIRDLARFLGDETPRVLLGSSGFNSALSGQSEHARGIRILSLAMSVKLNVADYRRSVITYSGELMALRTVDRFTLEFPDLPGCKHGFTQRSADGRLALLPIGAPARYREGSASFRVSPPWRPGDHASYRVRHRYRTTTPRPRDRELRRALVVSFDSVTRLELRLSAPHNWPCRPRWIQEDPTGMWDINDLGEALAPDPLGARQFAVTIDSPPAGYVYAISCDEP